MLNSNMDKNINNKVFLLANSKFTFMFLLLMATFFIFGFSSGENPLVGKWKCDADKTMENMGTSHLSDMEEQFYYTYFKNISLKVTEKEMELTMGGNVDKSNYEIVGKNNNRIKVYYPEEDENDFFELLKKDQFSSTFDMKGKKIKVFFEKQ